MLKINDATIRGRTYLDHSWQLLAFSGVSVVRLPPFLSTELYLKPIPRFPAYCRQFKIEIQNQDNNSTTLPYK